MKIYSEEKVTYNRVGKFFFDPNIQLDLIYVCIFIVKKCWQLSYKQNLSPWLDPLDSTKFYSHTLFMIFGASFIGWPKNQELFIGCLFKLLFQQTERMHK